MREEDEGRKRMAGEGPTESRFRAEQEEAATRSARDEGKDAQRHCDTENEDNDFGREAAGPLPVRHRRRQSYKRDRRRDDRRAERPQRRRQGADQLAGSLSRADRSVPAGQDKILRGTANLSAGPPKNDNRPETANTSRLSRWEFFFFYFQEIQQLRQHIVQVEQQLRMVLSPTYLPNEREKALQEQQVGLSNDTVFTWSLHPAPCNCADAAIDFAFDTNPKPPPRCFAYALTAIPFADCRNLSNPQRGRVLDELLFSPKRLRNAPSRRSRHHCLTNTTTTPLTIETSS